MPEPRIVQGLLDFESGNGNGYENWLREREARDAAIRREWAIPVGRSVRLRLRGFDSEFEGLLEVAEPPAVINRRQPLRLRIGATIFDFADIEQFAVTQGGLHTAAGQSP